MPMPMPTSAPTAMMRRPALPVNQSAKTDLEAVERGDHHRPGEELPEDAARQPARHPEMPAAVEDDVEDRAVEPAGDGDHRAETGDAEQGVGRQRLDDEVQHHVDDQHHRRGLDRGGGVLARIEAGGQHLDQHVGGQAEDDDRQHGGGDVGVARGEFSALEQRAGKRPGGDAQGERGGQGQEHAEVERLGLDMRGLVGLGRADVAADRGQDGGAERGADHAQRKLIEAVGVVEPVTRAPVPMRARKKVSMKALIW